MRDDCESSCGCAAVVVAVLANRLCFSEGAQGLIARPGDRLCVQPREGAGEKVCETLREDWLRGGAVCVVCVNKKYFRSRLNNQTTESIQNFKQTELTSVGM